MILNRSAPVKHLNIAFNPVQQTDTYTHFAAEQLLFSQLSITMRNTRAFEKRNYPLQAPRSAPHPLQLNSAAPPSHIWRSVFF